MTPAPSTPLPGSMTVPPLFGWEHVLLAMVLVVLAAAVGLVLLAVGRAGSARNEWQAWLDGRSAHGQDLPATAAPPVRRPAPADAPATTAATDRASD